MNYLRTAILLAGLTALFMGVGYLIGGGTGALIALVSRAARREIEGVARSVEKIETAVEPRFQQHFVEAMAIPHASAPPQHLSQAVELPARKPASAGDGRGRERRSAHLTESRR